MAHQVGNDVPFPIFNSYEGEIRLREVVDKDGVVALVPKSNGLQAIDNSMKIVDYPQDMI